MQKPLIIAAVLGVLFGTVGGFVAGYIVAPENLVKEASLSLQASKLADDKASLDTERLSVQSRVVTLRQTAVTDTYACVQVLDDGHGPVQATCKDVNGNELAHIEQRFDDYPSNQGVVENVEVVLESAGTEKRYSVPKFWDEYMSPSCVFTYLDGSGASLTGNINCEARERDRGRRLSYTFVYEHDALDLWLDCDSETSASGVSPIVSKSVETCKNYAEPQ